MTPDSFATGAKLLAGAAVVSLVFSQGLKGEFRQLLSSLRRPGLLFRSAVTVLVLVPAAALLVGLGTGLERRAVAGIVLMGVSPAAPLVLWRAGQAGGDESFASSLDVVLAILAVASVPLSLALLSLLFPASHVAVSPWAVAGQVSRVQLVPLAAGMGVRAIRPGLAAKLARPLARLAVVLLVLFVVVAVAVERRELVRIGSAAYAAMAVTVAVSIVLGHLLGGPASQNRTVLAVASALRNPGLALLVVQLNFRGQGVGQVVLAYALVTLVFLGTYGAWRKRVSSLAT